MGAHSAGRVRHRGPSDISTATRPAEYTFGKKAPIDHQHAHHESPAAFGPGPEERLGRSDRFYESVNREIVEWLAPAPGSRVLDTDCGAAGFTELLAGYVGEDGLMDAVDASQHLLEFNRSRLTAGDSGGRDRREVHAGDDGADRQRAEPAIGRGD